MDGEIIETGGTTPPVSKHGIPHRDFLERALVAAGEWTRYSDPKALGVLVVLGIGLNDLLDHASRFVHPHEAHADNCHGWAGHSCQAIASLGLFILAVLLAAAVVAFVTHALFSRMTLKGLLGEEHDDPRPKSRFFFGEVSRYGSQEAYAQAVLAKTEYELLRDMAGQVYEVSTISQIKHMAVQRAYAAALAFLAVWVVARTVLTTVG
jgi:hypothetical protein